MDGTASTRQFLGEQVGKVGGRGCYPIARLDAPRCHRVMWRSRIGEPTKTWWWLDCASTSTT